MWVLLFVALVAANSDIFVLENQLNATQCESIVAQARGPVNISRDPTWKGWDNQLFHIFDNALRLYQAFIGHPLKVDKSRDYILIRRNATQDSVAPFCDYQPVGMILFVNSDVAGGEWLFSRQGKTFEPVCGRLVVFPDTFTHPHAIKSVRLGTSWVVFASFH